MLKRSVRTLSALAALATVAAVVPAAAASAGTIGPKQYFTGLVGGKSTGATIGVLCAGAAAVGHPLPDQTVAVKQVFPPVTSTIGYTGLTADSIQAWLSWPTPTPVPDPVLVATFTSYNTAAIPVDITVPCGGTGTMSFIPNPDDGGRASTVQVTFLNIGA